MNTVLKGNDFENQCYILIKRLLDNYDLGILPNNCSVYQKKGYYSRDRDSNIIFDVSIELWLKGAQNYSLLYIIECKNYEKKVPVDDVEEFYAKVQQVSGANLKGVFISKSGFQDGAYRYAKSRGIMLIQADSDITFNIILHKTGRLKEKEIEETFRELDTPEYQDLYLKEFIHKKWERKIEKNILLSFIYHLNSEQIERENLIPILSRKDIDERVYQILLNYDSDISDLGKLIHIPSFKDYLYSVFELEITHVSSLGNDSQGRKILSRCSFLDRKIEIDLSIAYTNRYNFILGHELGHFFLHNKLSISQKAYEGFDDTTPNFSIQKRSINNDRGWIEWQANAFASSLVMPKESFLIKFRQIQDRIGLRPGRPLFVDQQKCNIDDFNNVTKELSIYFSTTITSVIYRLESLDLIRFDKRYQARHISAIVNDLYPDVFT